MSGARERILSRLYASAREESMPPAWQSQRKLDDLITRFTESLTSVSGEVIHAKTLDNAVTKLSDLLEEIGAERVAANDEPPLAGLDLPETWTEYEWHIAGQTAGDIRAFCAVADAGLSGASAALAETGTVIVESGPGRSRLVTLLPPVHIALVSTTLLTPDIFTWADAGHADLPSSLNMISGPSKTADIEQTLAVGVHGPKRFIVLLYDE